jgi:hypothetical protein
MNRTSKKSSDKKRKRRTASTDFVRNLKIVDNIPEGGELFIDAKEFVRIFRDEIQKKLFKKSTKTNSK